MTCTCQSCGINDECWCSQSHKMEFLLMDLEKLGTVHQLRLSFNNKLHDARQSINDRNTTNLTIPDTTDTELTRIRNCCIPSFFSPLNLMATQQNHNQQRCGSMYFMSKINQKQSDGNKIAPKPIFGTRILSYTKLSHALDHQLPK